MKFGKIGASLGASLLALAAITAASCGKAAPAAAGKPVTVAQGPCRSNDAACFQAQAKAAEDAADRLLNGQGAAAPAAPNAAPQPPGRAAAPAAAAGGGGLANGEYDCGGGYPFIAMGKVDIQGGRYRYRPFDDVVSGFQPYSVAGGKISWSGKFGGLDDPPARIVNSIVETFGFNVNYLGSPRALINTMSCRILAK